MRELSSKQKQAAMWIGYGDSQAKAAEKTGVDENTISNWKHNQNGIGEAFSAEIRKWADRFCGEISGEALAALRKSLIVPDDRVMAGKAILDRQAKIERREIELIRLEIERQKAKTEADAITQPRVEVNIDAASLSPDELTRLISDKIKGS